jgi:ABC-type multidrug transport system ATPase subunit
MIFGSINLGRGVRGECGGADWCWQPASGVELQVANLRISRGDRSLLEDTSLSVGRHQLAAIVGPSGAGKTTLVHVIVGEMAPDAGEVTVDGLAIASPQEPVRTPTLIRYVPQETALHAELSVSRTLWYAVALRRAFDLNAVRRRELIAELADDVEITHRLDAPLKDLSSGERKRVSLAVELASKPHLLILDEPGSGLDVARDRSMMAILERLSRSGTTVVCVTHNIDNLDLADHVIVLGEGGRVAFSGRPENALAECGVGSWADLMKSLVNERPERQARQKNRPPYACHPKRLEHFLRTWWLLSRRQAELTLNRGRPRQALSFTSILAIPALGALIAAASDRMGWRGPDAGQLVAVLAIISALLGASLTYSDLVDEKSVIKREYRIGVSGLQVVSAKMTVVAVLSILLTFITVLTYSQFRDLGGSTSLAHPAPILSLSCIVYLVMTASAAVGLTLSALSSDLHRAVTLVTVLAIVQVALNGVMFDLPKYLTWPSVLIPARIGVAAQAAYLGIPNGGLFWAHESARFWADIAILILLAVVYTVTAGLLLDRRCRRMQ